MKGLRNPLRSAGKLSGVGFLILYEEPGFWAGDTCLEEGNVLQIAVLWDGTLADPATGEELEMGGNGSVFPAMPKAWADSAVPGMS